jgi:SAM-dependent methyltransferase
MPDPEAVSLLARAASAPPACLLCGSKESRVHLVGRDRLFARPGAFTVRRCAGCGLRFLWPRPELGSIEELYPSSYFEEGTPHHGRLAKPADRKAEGGLAGLKWRIDCAVLRRLGYARQEFAPPDRLSSLLEPTRRHKLRHKVVPARGALRMLEVGCGNGAFLYRHQALGWEAWGVELSRGEAERARAAGLNVQSGRIEDANLPRGHFDLIVLLHVLEHLDDPAEVLRELAPLLAPGGQILIEVPNGESLGSRWWGTWWFALELPRHFWHFSVRDLERLAERSELRVARWLTRHGGDWHQRSFDFWLEDQRWLPDSVRRSQLGRRLRLEKRLRWIVRALARGRRGDALRAWLEPVRGGGEAPCA